MTKDRRLGRGLAALLGTPHDEETGNTPMTNSNPASTAARRESIAMPDPVSHDRNETIHSMAREAKAQAAHNGSGVMPLSIPIDQPASSAQRIPSHTNVEATGIATREIPVNLIDANPFQPRRQFHLEEIESLAQSIKEHQQLQPILVRQVGQRFQLISGERRLRATVHAKLPTIRAEIRIADDRLVAELAIIENLQRKDLNAIEKAMSFKRYITEHRCTQDELAQRLKIDRSTIANMMRLLELPEPVTEAILNDRISAGHAKALLSLGSSKEQMAFLKLAIDEGWSVRETESRVAQAVAEAATQATDGLAPIRRRKSSKPEQIYSLENELKMQLGTRVEINQTSRGRGRIAIHFNSIEEFERIRNLLANDKPSASKRVA